MQAAVVYLTRTGHSRKIAEAIAQALQVPAQDAQANPTLNGIDLLYIVGGIYGGQSDPALLAFAQGLNGSMVKRAALLTSCASGKGRQSRLREALEQNNVPVAQDEFVCKGSFLFLRPGRPNQADIDTAVAFARRVAQAG